MRPDRKQSLKIFAAIAAASFIVAPVSAMAGTAEGARVGSQTGETAGGVAIGDGQGGVTDRAYVTAPPHYMFIVEKERGSFLDCGEGQDIRATDSDGRDLATLRCGVTLTETVVIPAAASSARIIVHY